MNDQSENHSQGINNDVTLAAFGFLACIVASFASCDMSGLDLFDIDERVALSGKSHLLFLGIDQHARQLTILLRNQQGDVLLARQVSTRPEKFLQFFDQLTQCCAKHNESFIAVLEALVRSRSELKHASFASNVRNPRHLSVQLRVSNSHQLC